MNDASEPSADDFGKVESDRSVWPGLSPPVRENLGAPIYRCAEELGVDLFGSVPRRCGVASIHDGTCSL